MPKQPKSSRDLARFAEMFRAARMEAGISQHRVAEAFDVRQSAVSAWEAGESEPDREVVFGCEELFDLQPGSLSNILGYGPPVATPITKNKAKAIAPNTRQAILQDPRLDKGARDALLATYRAVTRGLVGVGAEQGVHRKGCSVELAA